MTREQRVFYIAFKWVAKYWPHRVGRDAHIVTLPVSVWLDGQPITLDLQGKIRLYNKAAHMVISECPRPAASRPRSLSCILTCLLRALKGVCNWCLQDTALHSTRNSHG